jgi:membrane protein DedA with SNARE-associated domain
MNSGIWDSFLEIVYQLGYPGIILAMVLEGLGVPFPGDVVMACYGFLAANGHFSFASVYLASVLGCWIGSWFSFYIGKRFGMNFLHKFGRYAFLKKSHINRSQELSRKHAILILILGRFLPGVRTVSSYIAGIGNMDWAEFIIYSLIGFCMWCFTWVGIGFWVGDHWQEIVEMIHSYLLYLLVAGIICFAGYRLIKQIRAKRV